MIFLRIKRILQVQVATALVIAGCSGGPEDRPRIDASALPPLLQRYAAPLEPGKLLAFPSIPLSDTPEDPAIVNLLEDASFEYGGANWAIDGEGNYDIEKTSVLATDGSFSLAVLPKQPSNVTLSQSETARSRTPYDFNVLVFAPGAGDFNLEIRDSELGIVYRSETVRGPMSGWSRLRLPLVTGIETRQITVNLHCMNLALDNPVLLDQSVLAELPAENLLPDGTMEFIAEEDQMPLWYLNGQGAWPASEGYRGKLSFELPGFPGRSSSLVRMIPGRKELEGKAFWISAMIKSVSEGGGSPPPVTIAFHAKGADGTNQEFSKVFSGGGDWTEVSFMASMPEILLKNEGDLPPFQMLWFERPDDFAGQVYIDEVIMIEVPASWALTGS